MVITEIIINNVKGINQLVIKQNIQPNRPNILVAPNGYGKSSIATAFKSLLSNKIELKSDDVPVPCIGQPSLTINLSTNESLSANDTSNTIKDRFDVLVATSQLVPKSIAQRFGKVVTSKPFMDISPSVIMKTVPKKKGFYYDFSSIKSSFGKSGKILIDISKVFDNINFIEKIEKEINFHVFELKSYQNCIVQIVDDVNKQSKLTADAIKKWIEQNGVFDTCCAEFQKLSLLLKNYLELSKNSDAYLSAWQYIHVRQTMGVEFKKAVSYANYLSKKHNLDMTLAEINPISDRFKIVSKEKNSALIVEWPKAHLISSGQRDVMVLVSKLIECEYVSKKNCILIIDEFFDYLDDANTVAFQYYVSNLIDSFKKSKRILFPILLTHLDPNYLKHFCFNESKMNVVYLNEVNAEISKEMKKLVAIRENEKVKDDLDKYYFHFSVNDDIVCLGEQFDELKLNKDWSKPSAFKKKIDRERRRYLFEPDDKYDPLAVCLSVRLRIEELVYGKLQTDAQKHEFLQTHIHGTNDKLHYAQSCGIQYPETYHLLGVIYNHPLHSTENVDLSKPLSMKLNNPVIKKMIRSLWS